MTRNFEVYATDEINRCRDTTRREHRNHRARLASKLCDLKISLALIVSIHLIIRKSDVNMRNANALAVRQESAFSWVSSRPRLVVTIASFSIR